jgi:two-component system response regulator RegA
MRLLFVDDHDVMRISLGTLLADLGHEVTEAASLSEARERLEHGGAFDVVLLDHSLQDGKGTELVPDVRRKLPAAKVVLLSGTARWDPTMDVDLLLENTLDPGALLQSIEKLAKR